LPVAGIRTANEVPRESRATSYATAIQPVAGGQQVGAYGGGSGGGYQGTLAPAPAPALAPMTTFAAAKDGGTQFKALDFMSNLKTHLYSPRGFFEGAKH
jgi:hypothetical protein